MVPASFTCLIVVGLAVAGAWKLLGAFLNSQQARQITCRYCRASGTIIRSHGRAQSGSTYADHTCTACGTNDRIWHS